MNPEPASFDALPQWLSDAVALTHSMPRGWCIAVMAAMAAAYLVCVFRMFRDAWEDADGGRFEFTSTLTSGLLLATTALIVGVCVVVTPDL